MDSIRYMILHQEHFGRKFYQDKKTGYWISTDYPRIRAHRWVWVSIHGKIPPGYHIHHKNENKSDNRIENLELIERNRHLRHHYTEENRERSRLWINEIRPLTKKWHASEEGKKWHRIHALKMNFGKKNKRVLNCDDCGNQYETTKESRSRFCSNNCKSRWRRKNHIDDVSRTCKACYKLFVVNKYSKIMHCSRSCGCKLKGRKKNALIT